MDSPEPFRAFVSYCHADAAFAAWLQRKLETYRLPRRLADRVAPLPGQPPGRLGPVFRDRADLSAAEDLSEAVRQAIARSSALVVVASPDGARSQWVEREIELFRELHPGSPILVALARGEPEVAVPPLLRTARAEPLAADFRAEGDGRSLAFLKIVAGLTGLPLDALVQRDAQRQLRRVTAVTLGTLVLTVAMAALLVMALQARALAERRRADAEGLVEFMLTPLRTKLRGTGDVEVMSAVNARALAYYVAQGDLRALPDESLERRARVLHAMGEDDVNRGRLDKARVAFGEAHRATAAILARRPANGDAIFAHAQSEYWIGLVAWKERDRATATRHWQAYARQAEALAAAEPGSVRGLMEQGYAQGDLCDLDLSDLHDLVAAEEACAASVRFVQAALARSPGSEEILQALANRHGWMAQLYLELARYRDALASRRAEASLMDRLLAAQPRNVEYALRRSWSDIGTANILTESKAPAEAVAVLRRSLAQHQAIFSANSRDQRVIETRLRTQLLLAKALRASGQDYAAALAQAEAEQKTLAGFGREAAATGQAIRAGIWPRNEGE